MPSEHCTAVGGVTGGVTGFATQLLPTFSLEAGQAQRVPLSLLYSPGLSVRKHSSRLAAGISGQVAAVQILGKQTNRVPFTFAKSFLSLVFVQSSCQLFTLAPDPASN